MIINMLQNQGFSAYSSTIDEWSAQMCRVSSQAPVASSLQQ